jgi:hypothetical protein
VIDIFNHRTAAKVSWIISAKGDPSGNTLGTFSLLLNHKVAKYQQIFNNYAPKGNEELLMGYGFCIANNPCDQFALRLAKPPDTVINVLTERYPRTFNGLSESGWNDEIAGNWLRGKNHYSGGHDNTLNLPCLRGIPLRLFLTLSTICEFCSSSDRHPNSDESPADEEMRMIVVWLDTLDAILQRLEHKRGSIRQFDPVLESRGPHNAKQVAAKMYRDGQLQILDEIIGELESLFGEIERDESSMGQAFEGVWGRWKSLIVEENKT